MATPQYMEETSSRDASPMPSFITLIALGQAVAALMCGAFADKTYYGWRLVRKEYFLIFGKKNVKHFNFKFFVRSSRVAYTALFCLHRLSMFALIFLEGKALSQSSKFLI